MAPGLITSFFKTKKKRSQTAENGPGEEEEEQNSHTSSAEQTSATMSQQPAGSTDRVKRRRTMEPEDPNEEEEEESTEVVIDNPYAPEAVQELLSSLNDTGGWKSALRSTWESRDFAKLAEFVARERASQTIYPPAADLWTSLNSCPLDQVKVVIVGQDPYHGPGQAHGLCFSVRPQVRPIPPSLKNIYLELATDPNVHFDPAKGETPPQTYSNHAIPPHGHLIRWAQQGVLLINTVWSVRRGKPQSHQKQGWEQVTSAILRTVLASRRKGKKDDKVVFLLWGKPALERVQKLQADLSRAVILSSSHPSPLGARKTSTPFIGSQCFGMCNFALQRMGQTPIDWNVDGPLPTNDGTLARD